LRELPQVVHIKGIEYTVKLCSDADIAKVKDAPEDVYALTDFDSSQILICDYIPIDSAWCALWHEILHAIASGFESLDICTENSTETVACNVFQILRDIHLL